MNYSKISRRVYFDTENMMAVLPHFDLKSVQSFQKTLK